MKKFKLSILIILILPLLASCISNSEIALIGLQNFYIIYFISFFLILLYFCIKFFNKKDYYKNIKKYFIFNIFFILLLSIILYFINKNFFEEFKIVLLFTFFSVLIYNIILLFLFIKIKYYKYISYIPIIVTLFYILILSIVYFFDHTENDISLLLIWIWPNKIFDLPDMFF